MAVCIAKRFESGHSLWPGAAAVIWCGTTVDWNRTHWSRKKVHSSFCRSAVDQRRTYQIQRSVHSRTVIFTGSGIRGIQDCSRAILACAAHGHVVLHPGGAAEILLRQLGKNLFRQHRPIQLDDQPCGFRSGRLAGGRTKTTHWIGKRWYFLIDGPGDQRVITTAASRPAAKTVAAPVNPGIG